MTKLDEIMMAAGDLAVRKYRLTGITEMLGTQPAKEDVRELYIKSKEKTGKDLSDEDGCIEENEKGITVFMRDKHEGNLVLMDYMVKGFFKSAFRALYKYLDIQASDGKIDEYLFVYPRFIPIMRGGYPIYGEDDIFSRPLRAKTAQGQRVAIAYSEKIDAPWQIDIEVKLLANKVTPKSKAVTFEAVELALDHGKDMGISQWRNGGYGRFTWERIEE